VLVLILLLGAILAAGCELTVAAASDLAALDKPLRKAIPGCDITIVFGSSGMLSRQIIHGADYDVFLSASRQYVDSVVEANAADPATVTPYATGRIAWWSRKPVDLEAVRHLAIANPAHAPYGKAAKQALERQGLWQKLESKIVFGENVRQAWQFASTGNADATITAWSLVHDKGGKLIEARWHDPIVQVGVVPGRSRNPKGAQRFLAWLNSAAGRAVLAGDGFSPPPL
jgi:molybdate transport system substrate-binding protein